MVYLGNCENKIVYDIFVAEEPRSERDNGIGVRKKRAFWE